MLILVLGDEPGLEAKHILIVGEELGHVLFGGFGLQAEHTAQRVLRSTIAVERRNLVLNS